MLTVQTLIEARACADQVSKFRAAFPNGAPLTVETALSVAQEFDWRWAARKLLPPEARKLYNETCAAARKLYNETCAAARKLYNETCAPARKLYNETCAAARKLYNETCAAALKLYNETCAPALKLYNETCARTFAKLYIAHVRAENAGE